MRQIISLTELPDQLIWKLPEGLSKMPNARNFLWNVVAPSFLGLLYREPPVSDNAMAMAM